MVWLERSMFTTTEASARSQQSPQAKNHAAMAVAQSKRRIAIPGTFLVDSAGSIVAPPEPAKKRGATGRVNRLLYAGGHETAGAFPLDFQPCRPSICLASAIRIFLPSASLGCCAVPA